jgi:hypothetical protein
VTTGGHAQNVLALSREENIWAWVGGGPSERQARADWTGAGVPLQEPPVSDVWAGIERVYSLLKTRSLVIHACCEGLIDEIGRYQRKRDKAGEPTNELADKDAFHACDCLRYIVAFLASGETTHRRVVYEPVRIR